MGDAAARERLIDRQAANLHARRSARRRGRGARMAVEYAKDRVQFGRPIGSFQAVKHRCADMLVDVEGMRSTVYWAAWCIGADDPDASIAASTAKIWCARRVERVMASALQVHGGIGFTWEHDLHFFLKRAQLDQLVVRRRRVPPRPAHRALRPRVEAGESYRVAADERRHRPRRPWGASRPDRRSRRLVSHRPWGRIRPCIRSAGPGRWEDPKTGRARPAARVARRGGPPTNACGRTSRLRGSAAATAYRRSCGEPHRPQAAH